MKKFTLEIRLYPISKFLQNIYNGAVKDTVDIIRKYGFKIGALAFTRAYNQEIILYWGSMAIFLFKLFSGKMSIEPVRVVPVTIAIYGLSKHWIQSLSIKYSITCLNTFKKKPLSSFRIV